MANIDCDFCVIGAGAAGLTVAAGAAAFGRSVTLIEKGEMGGECLNTGCVPSKALLAAASIAATARRAGPFGVRMAEPEADFAAVLDHVRETIATIAPHDSQERFEKMGVRVIRAAGRFVDGRTLEAGGDTIRARRFVIATGSRPAMPAAPGLKEAAPLTNETMFRDRPLPEHLLIMGAGPVGLEMAQAHARLGSRVTVAEAFDPLPRDEPEFVSGLLEALAEDGVEILTRARITQVRSENGLCTLELEGQQGARTLTGDALLVAAGRKPNVEGLGLEAAGIETGPRGIIVDARLRTTNKRVYAAGDVTGLMALTHAASWQGGLILRHALFRLPVAFDKNIIPRVIYTDPELASVGLGEREARERFGAAAKVLEAPLTDSDRAVCERRDKGRVKIIAGRRGRILGAHILGPHAGELIAPLGLAVARGLKVRDFLQTVIAYPTYSELSRKAALAYYGDATASPWTRLAMRLLGGWR